MANCSEKEALILLCYSLRDKFYYAEQLYDYVKYERVYENSAEIQTFKDILTLRLIKDPITCLVKNNLIPVFVDVEKDTFCLDPETLEAAITPKTKAIVPVHLYGQPCDMTAIMDIAKRYKLAVVEDNAQAH